jgi:hypothetical protein
VERYIMTPSGELPGGLGAGKTAPDDRNSRRHTATASGVGATSHSLAHLMQRL